jgi:cysteine desulfurase family protein
VIYFDNAATTLTKPPGVAKAVAGAIGTFGSVARGACKPSLAAGMAVLEAREKVARLFGVPSAKNVSFVSGATEAINIVVEGLLEPGDHAITTAASHNSLLRPLYRKAEHGCGLSILPVAADATIDYAELESLFRPNTRLMFATHASNLTGDLYDIARIARICHEREVLCALDCAQTAGRVPLDMEGTAADIFVFTGHKGLFGPQGTGGLCLGEGVEVPPFMVGGSGTRSYDRHHPSQMPERLEAGTMNSHGIAGLSAGLDYVESTGVATINARVDALVGRFEAGVRTVRGATIYGRRDGSRGCGIVALNIGDMDSSAVSDRLNTEHDICTRAGAHCAPLMHRAMGTVEQGAVRFSFSPFNTEEEIDQGVAALRAIACG